MSSVDNRLVKMTFDNAEFERRASTSLGTLGKLKQALDFSGAAKGMESIQAGANGVNFDGLLQGIEALNSRFSVLGEFVHNTFLRMVESAVNAGKQIAEALTITPMKEGFSEYELKMGSIQTIMAATGADLGTVNRKLDELNEYADKTIYSFSDMTSSIGKFTNAGVDLDTAVSAIEGISNAAALAGADTHQASSAMFNLSQALSAGYLGLVDWRSINLTAGIGTEAFRRQLIDTAVAMGTLREENGKYISTTTDLNDKVSDAFDVFEGFDNSLSHRWATKDVIMQAMSNFGTDVRDMTDAEREAYETQLMSLYGDEEKVKSIIELGQAAADAAKDIKTFSQLIDTLKEALGTGWATSWEYIVGDFEEAKQLWTEIYGVLESYINASADARNLLLKDWSESANGRIAIIDGIRNAFTALSKILGPIGDAFTKVFGTIELGDLERISVWFRDFTAGLILTDDQASSLGLTLQLVFGFVKNVIDGLKSIGGGLFDIFTTVRTAIEDAIGLTFISRIGMITTRFQEFAEAIRPSEQTLENLGKLVKGIVSVLRALAYVAIEAGSALFDALGKIFGDLAPQGQSFMELIGQIGDWLSNIADQFQNTFTFDVFSNGFDSMAEAIKSFIDILLQFTHLDSILDWLKNFFTVAEDGSKSLDIFAKIGDVFNNVLKTLGDLLSGIDLSKIDILKTLEGIFSVATLKKVYDILKGIYETYFKNPEETLGFIATLKKNIEEFTEHLIENLDKISESLSNTLKSIQTSINANAILKIGIAIGILVLALAKLAELDTESLASGVLVIGALMTEITLMTSQLAKMKLADPLILSQISTTLLKIAAAIWVLADAVAKLSEIDGEKLGRGLMAITTLLVELTGVAFAFSKFGTDLAKGASSLIAFAAAIWILSSVVKTFAELPLEGMQNALSAITILIAELVAVAFALSNSDIVKKPEQMGTVARNLVVFSAAVKILASIVKDFAELSNTQLQTSIGALTIVMAELVAVAIALSNTSVVQKPDQLSKVSTSLVVFSAAIKILASVVKDFAALDSDKLTQGLVGLAVIMASVVAAAWGLAQLDLSGLNEAALGLAVFIGSVKTLSDITIALSKIPFDQLLTGILGLIAVMGLLAGAAMIFSRPELDPAKIAAVSAALLVFSLAMGVMTLSMTALAAIGIEGIVIALIGMAAALGVFGVAAYLLEPVIPAMIAMAGAVALFGAGLALMGVGIGVATAGIAMLVATLVAAGASIGLVLNGLLDFISRLGTAVAEMFVGFVTVIAENGPVLVQAIADIISTILQALQENIPMIIETVLLLLTEFLQSLAEYVPQMAQAGLELIGGLLQAVAENLPQILDAAITIVVEFVNGIASRLDDIIDAAFKMIIGFIDGLANAIRENHNALYDAIGNLITAIIEAIIDGITKIGQAAGDLILGPGGFLEGISGFFSDLYKAGQDLVQGFIDGILSFGGAVWDAACGIANDAWNAITGTLDEHSPSRLTFGGGENFVLGFVNGIVSLRDKVKQEAAATAYAALDAFNTNIDTESIYSPTITPVIDLTNAQNGINSLNNMMYSVPDAYNISANLAKNNSIPQELLNSINTPSDYTSIIDRMDKLEATFDKFTEQLAQMNIVMDSGALVGAIAPGIDDAMGMRATLSSRGVF